MNDNTNVYETMKGKFSFIIDNFTNCDKDPIKKEKEIATFINHNTQNHFSINGGNNGIKSSISFYDKNNNIAYLMYAFKRDDGNFKINYFPITENFDCFGFTIENLTRGIVVDKIHINEDGIILERTDLERFVTTMYFNSNVLDELSKHGIFSVANFFVNNNIDFYSMLEFKFGIKPDKIIYCDKIDNNIRFSVQNFKKIVERTNIKIEENDSFYSKYYEFMIANNFYDKTNKKIKSR